MFDTLWRWLRDSITKLIISRGWRNEEEHSALSNRYLTDLSCTWMKNTVADYLLKNSICEIWPGTYNERTTSLAPYYVERTYGTVLSYAHTTVLSYERVNTTKWMVVSVVSRHHVTTYRGINMSVCPPTLIYYLIVLSHLITTVLYTITVLFAHTQQTHTFTTARS